MRALLGQRRECGGEPRQSLGDDPVGGEIGLRYRRAVDLAVHPMAVRSTARMVAPARITSSVSGCSSAAARIAIDRDLANVPHSWAALISPSAILSVFPCCRSAALCWQPARSQCIKPASMRDSPFRAFADFQELLMSGTPSPGPAPDALELAALLCSRVCHDLISPVGAIVNGLEVLDDNPKPDDREFALDLIRKSAKTASARLQFCRLAFGAAGSAGAQIDLGDAQTMARGHLEDGKTTIAWNLPRVLLPKNRVKRC